MNPLNKAYAGFPDKAYPGFPASRSAPATFVFVYQRGANFVAGNRRSDPQRQAACAQALQQLLARYMVQALLAEMLRGDGPVFSASAQSWHGPAATPSRNDTLGAAAAHRGSASQARTARPAGFKRPTPAPASGPAHAQARPQPSSHSAPPPASARSEARKPEPAPGAGPSKPSSDGDKARQARQEALQLLGFQPGSSPTAQEIAKAYKALALANHPDKKPAEEREAATARFQQIANARDLLVQQLSS